MTGGVVRYNTEVVISPTPLEKMDDRYYMATPDNMQDDIGRFNVTVANYDHIYVVGPWTHWAYWTKGWYLDGLSWSSSNLQSFNTSNPTGTADYLHETIHGLTSWYYNETRLGTGQSPHGVQEFLDTMTDNPEDAAASWGYNMTSGGSTGRYIIGSDFDHYNKLYMDILNGRVCHVSGSEAKCDPPPDRPYGLGPNAWKYPTRREAYHNLPAGYLAAHRTYPGEPATISAYDGPSYTGYIVPRNWKYAANQPKTGPGLHRNAAAAYTGAGDSSSEKIGTKVAKPFGRKA
ncbi:MAG: hypothetical protein M1831_000975 [Alyxoria varia]|nr:MAG: hypothetical protein M1831_000975 [Alyxoria varia]